jgi:predicted RNA-binding Zn-ribbon protein involved in translation (DUF1610 family)
MARCFSCGHEFDSTLKAFRSTLCPSCGADVRVCKNCVFYDPKAHWECRETIPEAVRDKERANFCDYFRLGENPVTPGGSVEDSSKKEARNAFDSLFSDDGN